MRYNERGLPWERKNIIITGFQGDKILPRHLLEFKQWEFVALLCFFHMPQVLLDPSAISFNFLPLLLSTVLHNSQL